LEGALRLAAGALNAQVEPAHTQGAKEILAFRAPAARGRVPANPISMCMQF